MLSTAKCLSSLHRILSSFVGSPHTLSSLCAVKSVWLSGRFRRGAAHQDHTLQPFMAVVLIDEHIVYKKVG